MDEAKRQLVRSWLTKAQHDLAAARKLAVDPDPYLDAAVYHCQQAAEKALKGFLVFHDQRFEKIHNLSVLAWQASSFATGMDQLLEACELLTPYATAYRYPGELMEPEVVEFEDALAAADEIYRFILSLMADDVRP
ncbi:MAG: HEPN domain-containing protein [Chloroflexi bacterium]|nr:HEPN domain-containing protein [Chloroflexota bacterium]